MIRVAIVDDQQLIRGGFRSLLQSEDDIEVVGEAGTGVEAVALVTAQRPDVVLMDIRMPDGDGLWATEQIAADPALSDTHIVIVTTFELDEYVGQAIRAGASGFLVKDTEPVELIRAVRVVAGGDALLSPGVTKRLLERIAGDLREAPDTAQLNVLTDREREVLGLVGLGFEQAAEAAADQLLVVDDGYADHSDASFFGMDAATRKPPPGSGAASRVPPSSSARSCMPSSPRPPGRAAFSAAPTPSSVTVTR